MARLNIWIWMPILCYFSCQKCQESTGCDGLINYNTKQMQKTRNILLFGSGLMAETVVIYLLKRPENVIHIASNIVADAKKIVDRNDKARCTFSQIDVTNAKAVASLVKDCEVAISYVPAFLHMHIAKVCLDLGKHLITASYVSPEMKELDEQAKAKGLIFLNELGLDPGIDHLATMKIIHQVEKEGGKILEYESWCGGLPSPDFCDNPLGYKFTWSPIGAFRALNNKALFINNNKEQAIESRDVQYYGAEIQLNQALTLEGYPNRNSVAYKETYGLKDATKVLRGTLRYRGFCTVINAWKELGLLEEKPVHSDTWLQQIKKALQNVPGANLQQKIWRKCFHGVKAYQSLSEQQKQKKFAHTIKAFKYFDMFNPDTKIWSKTKNSLENLVNLLEKKLNLKEGETDLVAMQHIFLIETKDKRKKILKSSLIQIGDKRGFSAMSVTVGTPTAIGAQLVLDGKIKERGVLIPKYEDIYEPVLSELAKEGIRLVDTEEWL